MARKQLIEIQQPVRVPNELGEPEITSWSTFARCYAEITQQEGSEVPGANNTTIFTITKMRFLIRYINGITRDMRVAFNDQTFGIVDTLDKLQTRQWLVLICQASQ